MNIILVSAAFLGAICLLFYGHNGNIKRSGELTAMIHHGLAALIGLYAAWISRDYLLTDSVMGANERFPLVNVLQHFNIGYFLYDLTHVIGYDREFILHHVICLLGLGVSDYLNIFGLANAVNVFLAESGSLMYNYYSNNKTIRNYKIFVAVYAVTRSILLVWSFAVYRQVQAHDWSSERVPSWASLAVLGLQGGLILLNLQFLISHSRTLLKLIREKKRN